ncbi:hypothetical protein DFJ74DRAFT_310825 [Hyaloraphidium curvatum]|nr:hypothetical protein DFJ74DRAFT_310825 [Hyaloraphidium curvatum]
MILFGSSSRTDSSNPADASATNLHPAAAAVDLSKVSRLVLKEKPDWTEARIDAAVAEYRRFATLAAAGVPMPPCLDVDEIWHAHILHTIDYAAFSAALLGPGSFLHHIPADPEDTPAEQREAMKGGYAAGLAAYRERFGAEPHAIWGAEMPEEADANCAPCLYKAEESVVPAQDSQAAFCFPPPCFSKASLAEPAERGGALCLPIRAAPGGALCIPRDAAREAFCMPKNAPRDAFCIPKTAPRDAFCIPKAASRDAFCIPKAASREAFCMPKTAPRDAFCIPKAASGQAFCMSIHPAQA